jgi:uncharacterized repeat protein (TIGR01451 family)
MTPTSTRSPVRRRRARAALTGSLALLLAAALPAAGTAAYAAPEQSGRTPGAAAAGPMAPAPPKGCGFGQGGPYAPAVCWIDLSAFDFATARGAAGQTFTVKTGSGYTLSFKLNAQGSTDGMRALVSAKFPAASGATLGTAAYKNTPGKPALLQQSPAAGASGAGQQNDIHLTNIKMTAPDGTAVTGFDLVVADAEATTEGEELRAESDQPISNLVSLAPGSLPAPCLGGLTGLDTKALACKGGAPTAPTALVSYIHHPTNLDVRLVNKDAASKQGVAFGVALSKVGLTKKVERRTKPSDAFDLKVTDSDGRTAGTASTGRGSGAATGTLFVPTRFPTAEFTFRETPAAGTDMADYTTRWSCTHDGQTIDPSNGSKSARAAVTEQTHTALAGGDLQCTVVNTGKTPSGGVVPPKPYLTVRKAVNTAAARPGQKVTYTVRAVNSGRGDAANVRITDRLADVLDNARFNNDAYASTGRVVRSGSNLLWSGSLKARQSVTITYSVTVNRLTRGSDRSLDNPVGVSAPGSNCAARAASPACSARTVTPVRGRIKFNDPAS